MKATLKKNKNEDDLKKIKKEDKLKINKKGRRPQKK